MVDITLGNNVSYIGDYCFYNCVKLKSIKLTDNLTQINKNAFENCSELSDIYESSGIWSDEYIGLTINRVYCSYSFLNIDNQ